MPYRPLIGALSESTRILDGLGSTSSYEPGIGEPSGWRAYRPAGMVHGARAVTTMRGKRIVYADGSENRRFFSSGGAGGGGGCGCSAPGAGSTVVAMAGPPSGDGRLL